MGLFGFNNKPKPEAVPERPTGAGTGDGAGEVGVAGVVREDSTYTRNVNATGSNMAIRANQSGQQEQISMLEDAIRELSSNTAQALDKAAEFEDKLAQTTKQLNKVTQERDELIKQKEEKDLIKHKSKESQDSQTSNISVNTINSSTSTVSNYSSSTAQTSVGENDVKSISVGPLTPTKQNPIIETSDVIIQTDDIAKKTSDSTIQTDEAKITSIITQTDEIIHTPEPQLKNINNSKQLQLEKEIEALKQQSLKDQYELSTLKDQYKLLQSDNDSLRETNKSLPNRGPERQLSNENIDQSDLSKLRSELESLKIDNDKLREINSISSNEKEIILSKYNKMKQEMTNISQNLYSEAQGLVKEEQQIRLKVEERLNQSMEREQRLNSRLLLVEKSLTNLRSARRILNKSSPIDPYFNV